MDANEKCKIVKSIISTGTKSTKFIPGSRVYFHFQTIKCDDKRTVIDDSKKNGKPMELVLGKSFKFEVWESIIQMMSINEVARFTVDKTLVTSYPFLSKTLRDASKPPEQRNHRCCGVTLQHEGIGYEDLNELIKNPVDLEFIIELLKVESPEDYEKESWQLNEEEKLKKIPALKNQGNELYKQTEYSKACDKYAQAIGILEQLMLNEKPGEVEWNELNDLKRPLLLNYAMCKLQMKDFYSVIEHTSTVLKQEPENVKALFRRARAHKEVWNPEEAKQDFQRAADLDPSLKIAVAKEFQEIDRLQKIKDLKDKEMLKGKIF